MLLKHCVKDGVIDYAALDEESFYLFNYLRAVESLSKDDYTSWSKNEKLAFWINTYHACSLLLFLKNPYARMVQDIRENPNDPIITVFGDELSLNDIKHTIIRSPFLLDERVHCALSSLARGFPSLRNEAYLGVSLNLLLEEDVHRFLQDDRAVRIDHEGKKIFLSKIFKWFGRDFLARYSTKKRALQNFSAEDRAVLYFLASYMPDERKFIMSGTYTIEYFDFDWTINRSVIDVIPSDSSSTTVKPD